VSGPATSAVVPPEAIARAERALTQVIISLKLWAARDRITIRGAEALELARRTESARQEVVSLGGVRARRAISPAQREATLRKCGYRCPCGADLRGPATPHIDHVVSLARYGTNEPDNLQALCGPCNLSKGARR
jgi:hypothetical protein